MRSVGATFYYLVYSESRGLRPATMDWRYPLVSGVWPRWCVPALLPRQLPGNLRVQWVFHHFWFHSQRFFPSHDVFRWSFGPPDVDHSGCFVAVLLLQENIRLLLLRHYGTNFCCLHVLGLCDLPKRLEPVRGQTDLRWVLGGVPPRGV